AIVAKSADTEVGKRALQTAMARWGSVKETIGQYKLLLESNLESVDSEMDIVKKQIGKILASA
ncbi:hypothetical protein LW986_17915, partial [Erwinia amylovora]|uniref:hypothetical protein n=1 Tax=Erwinia amylovora TaxID=552 RepID=UPI0020BE25D9